jgi:adenine-specific DNA-methyltransferase
MNVINSPLPTTDSANGGILAALDTMTPGELKRLVTDMLTRQRLGLYWERNLIEHDRSLNQDHVFLELATGRKGEPLSCGDAPHQNLIIEGENFDALRLLRTTHAGKVRVILIDPPYNTGQKDFVYNDRYVREDDTYRHSLWLDWLHQRLLLARELLTSDGVILACINDDNRAKLELLMDQVFSGMRVGSFVWKTRSGSNDQTGQGISIDHEHILIYAGSQFAFTGAAKDFRQYKNPDNDPRGPWKTGDLTKGHSYKQRPGTYYPLQNPETGRWYPCNPTRVWAFSSEARLLSGQKTRQPPMEEWIRRGKIVWPDASTERVVVWQTKQELLDAIVRGDVPSTRRRRTRPHWALARRVSPARNS